jgi:glycosyltransferase involved in cell wall biosynthesis
MNPPLISVGVLSYERPELLQYSLDSVACQTHQHLEIIISDNASTNPDIRKVIEAFREKYPEAKIFFHEKNRGAFWNFNFVLQQATSPLFIWLADDDFWSPNFLESLLVARGTCSPSLTYSRAVPFHLEDKTLGVFAKERVSAKRGLGNVLRQTQFDSDSMTYGLFDTKEGMKFSSLLKSWPVPLRWKARFPTIEVDFTSYAFLYGVLLEADFINAREWGGIHYMIHRPVSPRCASFQQPMQRLSGVALVIGTMIVIHIMLAWRFCQAALVARHPAGVIFAPVAAAYLFLRRITKAAFRA